MDSLFDDDQDEVGSEIEAYCPSPRCKADTNHTVISMYEDEIRRVQCQVCSDVHAFRKPRGDTVETTEEVVARRKLSRKPTWEEAMTQVTEQELASCRPYSIRDTYEEMDVVSHPKFGTGFVTELLPDNKVEITFKDERRVLVHNRSDLATKMPDLAEMPAPRDLKKRKRRKKGPSELAARLLGERVEGPVVEMNPEATAAKLATAQRAVEEKRLRAMQIAATGGIADEEQLTPAQRRERRRLEREADKARKAAEKEVEKARKAAEKEADKARKAAEKEKLQAQKEKERARKQAQMEKDREKRKAQAERDKAKALAQKERDRERATAERERARKKAQEDRERAQRKAQADRERDQAQKQREREQAQKQRERERATADRERERVKAQKDREREQAQKQREREQAQKQRERERITAEREKARVKALKERERAAAERERKKKTAGKKKPAPAAKKKAGAKKSSARRR